MSADRNGRAFIETARQELRQYAQGLLHENERLRAASARLESDNRRLQAEVAEFLGDATRSHRERDEAITELRCLRARLAEIEQENERYAAGYQQIEKQTSDLSNLYVASYQLHASVDRQNILQTIQEIVINLIGSEEIAIFEGDESGTFRLASSIGVDSSRFHAFTLGEGPIGRRLTSGGVTVEDSGVDRADRLTACVPLKIGDAITGAIVVFRLLPHKPALESVDHELFALLAVHAATALYCARLHTSSLRLPAVAS